MLVTLKPNVTAVAHAFAELVLEAVCSASLADILGVDSGPRPEKHQRASLGGSKRTASRRLATTVTRGADPIVERMVAVLRAKPGGVRSAALRAQLKLDKRVFQRTWARALAASEIRKTGTRNLTTFHAT
jgi:hypothetical protein